MQNTVDRIRLHHLLPTHRAVSLCQIRLFLLVRPYDLREYQAAIN